MHVTSLEIILAVVAVFVVFGPKELPRRNKQPDAIKVSQRERAAYVPNLPSQYAAGRAPSPLQLHATDRPQFASGNLEGSPLPHELLRV